MVSCLRDRGYLVRLFQVEGCGLVQSGRITPVCALAGGQ